MMAVPPPEKPMAPPLAASEITPVKVAVFADRSMVLPVDALTRMLLLTTPGRSMRSELPWKARSTLSTRLLAVWVAPGARVALETTRFQLRTLASASTSLHMNPFIAPVRAALTEASFTPVMTFA